ncbi:hypothetical protein NL50_09715 [Clostridium acetobutylicum]|nr:hypothetical protein NL50_09715 [Clostridium acetobutylicum]
MRRHRRHRHHGHKVEKIEEDKEEIVEINKEEPQQKEEENISVRILTECNSDLVKFSIKAGFIPVRMPVIITEVVVNIDLENIVSLERPIVHIDGIKRRVRLESCRLIPETNKLFLNGTVIKSIQYTKEKDRCHDAISGEVKNMTINVPFRCVTRVKYIVQPIFRGKNRNLKIVDKNNEITLIESYREEEEVCCELVHAKFEELNMIDKIDAEKNMERIKQKMVMHITVRLIQNQTLFVLKET